MLGEDRPEEDRHTDEAQHRQHVGQRQHAVGDDGRARRSPPPISSVLTRGQPNGRPTVEFAGMDNPLLGPGLDRLRERRSVKWRLYGPGRPAAVGGRDGRRAGRAGPAGVADAMARGDTGYPWAADYAEASPLRRATRWGWGPDPAHDGDRARRDAGRGRGAQAGHRRPATRWWSTPPSTRRSSSSWATSAAASSRRRWATTAGSTSDALERAFGEATRGGGRAAYLLCNPQNPTGTVHTPEELTAALALAESHGVRVVADEIHAPSCTRGRASPPWRRCPAGGAGCRADVGVQGVQPGRAQGGHGGAGPGARSTTSPGCPRRCPRREPRRRDRPRGGLARRRRLARRAARRPRRQPAAAGRPARRAPARGGPPRCRTGTFLAWLDFSRPRARRRPGRGAARAGAGGAAPRARLRHGGAGHARLNFGTSPDIVREAVSAASRPRSSLSAA